MSGGKALALSGSFDVQGSKHSLKSWLLPHENSPAPFCCPPSPREMLKVIVKRRGEWGENDSARPNEQRNANRGQPISNRESCRTNWKASAAVRCLAGGDPSVPGARRSSTRTTLRQYNKRMHGGSRTKGHTYLYEI